MAKAPWARLLVLTLAFAAAYFVLRALPAAQCGFLHYEEVVNEDGEVEFCATNHAGFLDLTRLSYPVRMQVETQGELVSGRPVEVVLKLSNPGGVPIAPHHLALTHTEKLHLLVVDSALRDYHHVHPVPEDGLSGRYRFRFVPAHGGNYRLFAEFVPIRTRRQVVATGEIEVAGDAADPLFKPSGRVRVAGLDFDLRGAGGPLRTGVDQRFGLEVSRPGGAPASLETIMDAKGHMVAFDYEGKGFAHMHPIASVEPVADAEELDFLFNVPEPGRYRLWAQVKHAGEEVFAPFDLEVE
jgi:hypothetical protein